MQHSGQFRRRRCANGCRPEELYETFGFSRFPERNRQNSGLKIDGAPAADRAALGKDSKILHFDGFSNDIGATIVCLRALGAEITELGGGSWRVTPVGTVSDAECSLFCGESGSTLRFLLPIVGILGANAVFHMEGRLPERPLEPLRTHPLRTRHEDRKNGRSARLLREIVR